MSDNVITTQARPVRARRRKEWKPDSRGYYAKQLGYIRTASGKVQQHKFHLGKDLEEAKERDERLRALWNRFAKSATEPKPLWPEPLLDLAKQLARGETTVVVKRATGEQLITYSARLDAIRRLYPVANFVAETPKLEADCEYVSSKFASMPEVDLGDIKLDLPTPEQVRAHREAERILEEAGISTVFISPHRISTKTAVPDKPRLGRVSPREFGAITAGDPKEAVATAHRERKDSDWVREPTPNNRIRTLHEALNAYRANVELEYFDPVTERVTDWGRTQVRQVDTLKSHLSDQPLSSLNFDGLDALFGYWRRRPLNKRTRQPMTRKSVLNYLKSLKAALKWMDRSERISWRTPRPLDDFDCKPRSLPSDNATASLEQVDTFSLDELKLLMRYGQPLDRVFLLLGLNCGFGRAEIASLLVREVHFNKAHSPRQIELLMYGTTEKDSFIKRVRRKSNVYGEHILFPMTVRGIEWALLERKQFPDFVPDARLLLNGRGIPFDQPTAGGNDNRAIPNRFSRLIKRIQGDGQTIRGLSFGKLRKTAAQLIDVHSNGEVAAVFACHGQPVKTDNLLDRYRNRPFGRVFKAIRDVQAYLEPVFREAGDDPFERQPQAYLKRSVLERIRALSADGRTNQEIAEELNVSEMSVRRHATR